MANDHLQKESEKVGVRACLCVGDRERRASGEWQGGSLEATRDTGRQPYFCLSETAGEIERPRRQADATMLNQHTTMKVEVN